MPQSEPLKKAEKIFSPKYVISAFAVLSLFLALAVNAATSANNLAGNVILTTCGGHGYYSENEKATICCLPDKIRIVRSPVDTEERQDDGTVTYKAAFRELCRK